MNWKKIVGAIAPSLATALGGPLAGVAVREIGGKLLGNEQASEDQVAAAISGATPEQLAELKKIDADFEKRMAELGIELEKLDAGDRSDARARQVAMKDHTPNILGAIILLGFFTVMGVFIFHEVPDSAREIVLRALGTLDAMATGVVWFFFGSSRGSRQKDEIIGRTTEKR